MSFLKSMSCVAFFLVITACSDKESAQTYISQAESLLVEKQNSAAIIALKNALKVDAKNSHARFLLGQLYLQLGESEQAIKELERAQKFKFDIDRVLPLLARAYMLAEFDEEVLSLASQEKLLVSTNTQYLAYKTLAALRTGDKLLAEETVEKALSASDSDSYSMLANAYLAFSNQNTPHAGTLVERILTATPNNADALMLQGQIALVDKDYSLAIDSFKRYLDLQPNSGRVRLFIADALIKYGQYDEAEKIADEILAKVPTQPFLQYIKAMARFESKDYESASSFANQSLNSGFNAFSLKLVAGASAFYLNNHEQSNHHLQDLMPYISAEHPARRMLAISQLELGLIDDIGETLSGYDSSTQEGTQFLSTLSYELLEVGAIEKAKEMAKNAAKSQMMTAEQTARSGVLKLMMNDPSGIETLELAIQQNPELVSAELALAFASIKSGDLSRASTIAEKWLKEYPEKAGGYNLKATIFFKNNKLTEGKEALEKGLNVEPNNVYALTQLVNLAYYQKDLKQAKLLTEQTLKAHPKNIEVLRQYFEFHKDEKGLEVLTSVQQGEANNVQYGIVLAEALIGLNKYKQASALLNSYSSNVKTPKRYWKLLLLANEKQTEGKDIYTILDKWHKTNVYHIEPVILLANYWVGEKSPDRALNVLNNAFKNHPNNLMLNLVKMQIFLDNNRSADAKLLVTELTKLSINKDLLAGFEGRILLLDKNFEAAVPKLNQFYLAKPNNINVTYLAYALEASGKKVQAIELLEKHSGKNEKKINPRVSLSLANMYLAEDQGKAITEYERLISATPKNIVALNNLSWLYMDKGKLVQAKKYAKQAYDINNKIPNVVDTYAQVLLKLNQKDEALVKAQEAHELSKGKDIDIALNLAETLIANNKHKEANLILKDTKVITDKQQEKKQALLK